MDFGGSIGRECFAPSALPIAVTLHRGGAKHSRMRQWFLQNQGARMLRPDDIAPIVATLHRGGAKHSRMGFVALPGSTERECFAPSSWMDHGCRCTTALVLRRAEAGEEARVDVVQWVGFVGLRGEGEDRAGACRAHGARKDAIAVRDETLA